MGTTLLDLQGTKTCKLEDTGQVNLSKAQGLLKPLTVTRALELFQGMMAR